MPTPTDSAGALVAPLTLTPSEPTPLPGVGAVPTETPDSVTESRIDADALLNLTLPAEGAPVTDPVIAPTVPGVPTMLPLPGAATNTPAPTDIPPSETPQPSFTPTDIPPSETPQPSFTPTDIPPSATPLPTNTPAPSATPTFTPSPTLTFTPTPTNTSSAILPPRYTPTNPTPTKAPPS
jgi:hypothetical protein